MSTSVFARRSENSPDQESQQEASPSTEIIAPEGWFGDPLDRFEGRFFDGGQWTNQVSDNGVLRLDPSWVAASTVTSAGEATEFTGPDSRGSHDRRQIKIKVDVERRKGDRRAS